MKYVRTVLCHFVRTITFVSCLTVVATANAQPIQQVKHSVTRYSPDTLLVKFKPGAVAAERGQAHQQARGQVARELKNLGVSLVKVPRGSVMAAVNIYSKNPNVDYAEPNYQRLLFRPVTTEGAEPGLGVANNFNEQWALNNTGQSFGATIDPIFGTLVYPSFTGITGADINAPEAWGATNHGSSSVGIAVLDSGVACDHLDLNGKCIEELNFVDEHGSTLEDIIQHGTHVAGIAAASTDNSVGIAGVGWDTSIGALKVCWEDYSLAIFNIIIGQCDDADVADAIDHAVTSGLYQVINMSLAGPDMSLTLQSAVDNAWNEGLVLVAGAGNDYTNTTMYPAGYSNVISVGATDYHDNLAAFSSFGQWVDVLAPGTHILSTVPGGACGQPAGEPSDCYDAKSGTSMSTPHVSGLAALLWAHLPSPTNTDIRNIIETTADASGALQQNLRAWVQHGRINMSAALNAGGAEATTHYVQSIALSTVNVGRGNKQGRAVVAIVDNLGAAVAGATVDGSFTGSYNQSVSAITDASGIATLNTTTTAKGGISFTLCVNNVTDNAAPITSYDPASDAVDCPAL
ncbi:MAG: S8 family serine peptidase [Pseudomonadales bacterium]